MKKNASMWSFCLALLFLFLQKSTLSAQFGFTNEIERELTYAEMWQAIFDCKEATYSLENALVIRGKKDGSFVDSLMKRKPRVSAAVALYNVKFKSEEAGWLEDYSVQMPMHDVHFEQGFHLQVVSGLSLVIVQHCHFDGGINFFPEDKIFNVQIYNSTISENLQICFPEKPVKLYNIPPYLSFFNCEFNLKGGSTIQLNKHTDLFIENCDFKADSSVNFLTIRGELTAIRGKNTQIDVNLDFSDLVISRHIEWINTRFNTTSFNAVTFPSYTNNYMKWKQFQKGLSIIVKPESDFIDSEEVETRPFQIFDGNEYLDSSSAIYYDQLMATYSEFFRDYKDRGDVESANACYMSMKDIQTKRLKHLYETSQETEDWFNWKLNEFLKTFADYGTNPVKAIIFSIWTILGFAFLYFFFYSSWDKINRSFLIRQHRKVLGYFRTKQSMKDFYTKEHKEEFINYQNYKRELKASKGIPSFLLIFGRPLYSLSMFRFRFMTWLFNRTEIMHSSWADLPNNMKFKVRAKTFLFLSCYLLYLIFIRAINSIMLSVNAFSTLGFGDIPVTGLSRYLAIIEGFIGWFLLSIFSVSLISQILQN